MDKTHKEYQIKVGDVIPYRCSTGYVINYTVEKVKVDETGKTTKIRCRHGNGGANISFTAEEAMMLIENKGKQVMCNGTE